MRADIAASIAVLGGELSRLDALIAAGSSTSIPDTAADLGRAREQIASAIAALENAATTPAAAPRLLDRIVLIEPARPGEAFRTKVKLKAPEVQPIALAAAVPEVPTAAANASDDLTRIRGIDRALASRLAGLGVDSFAAIAGWDAASVHAIAGQLGLGRRISAGNWIEQAALLAGRSRTPAQLPEPAAATSPVEVAPQEMLEPVAQPGTIRHPDRLTMIRGLLPLFAGKLHSGGVMLWSDIAAWRRDDIIAWQRMLGADARIVKDGWIEQAAILAAGHETRHATLVRKGWFASLVAPPPMVRLPEVPAIPHAIELPLLVQQAPASTSEAEPAPQMPVEFIHAEAVPTAVAVIDIEREMKRLVANDIATPGIAPATGDFELSEPAATAPAGIPSHVSMFNIEDEEFQELHVSEADVVIVARREPEKPLPAASTGMPARIAFKRLRSAPPLDSIDQEHYAAYREHIEEASVEIVRPGQVPAGEQTRNSIGGTEVAAEPVQQSKSRIWQGFTRRD